MIVLVMSAVEPAVPYPVTESLADPAQVPVAVAVQVAGGVYAAVIVQVP